MALSWLSVSCKTDFLSPTIVTLEALHKFDLFFSSLVGKEKNFHKERLERILKQGSEGRVEKCTEIICIVRVGS